jgi:hypothetical protein
MLLNGRIVDDPALRHFIAPWSLLSRARTLQRGAVGVSQRERAFQITTYDSMTRCSQDCKDLRLECSRECDVYCVQIQRTSLFLMNSQICCCCHQHEGDTRHNNITTYTTDTPLQLATKYNNRNEFTFDRA